MNRTAVLVLRYSDRQDKKNVKNEIIIYRLEGDSGLWWGCIDDTDEWKLDPIFPQLLVVRTYVFYIRFSRATAERVLGIPLWLFVLKYFSSSNCFVIYLIRYTDLPDVKYHLGRGDTPTPR